MKQPKILFAAAIMIFLVSCAESDGTGTMKILLHCDASSKTLTVNDTVLDITKYSVSGSGPGGKTFALDSTSASVTLSSMTLGSWDVKASGLNSKGKEVAFGSLSFTLDGSGEPHTVNMSTLTGTGSLQIKYEWDSQITEPSILLVISGIDKSVYLKKTVNPVEGSTSCTFTAAEISSGFYLIDSILYSAGEKVTGSTEAIRIANGEKTTGTLSFRESASYSSNLDTLNVYRSGKSVLTGHLSGTKDVVEAGGGIKIDLDLDSSYLSSEMFSLTWYYDGEILQDSLELSPYDNSITLYPSTGSHILNAVVTNPADSSIGSVSWKFNAKACGEKGVALYISNVGPDSNPNLFLEETSMILALPDERFLIVSPDAGTMRLCRIYNNSLTVIQKLAASDEGWSFLSDVSYGYSSPYMQNFVLIDCLNNINILLYDRNSGTVKKAYRGEDVARFEKCYSNLDISFSDIRCGSFFTNDDFSGLALLSVSDSEQYLLGIKTNGTGVVSMIAVLKPDDLTAINGICVKSGKILCTGEQKNGFYCVNFNGSAKTSDWTYCNTDSHPQCAKIINSDNIIVSDGSSLKIFSCNAANYWNIKANVNVNTKMFEVSPDGMYVWVVTDDNSLVTYTTADNLFYRIGITKLNKTAVSMTLGGNALLIKNSDCSITICSISQGE